MSQETKAEKQNENSSLDSKETYRFELLGEKLKEFETLCRVKPLTQAEQETYLAEVKVHLDKIYPPRERDYISFEDLFRDALLRYPNPNIIRFTDCPLHEYLSYYFSYNNGQEWKEFFDLLVKYGLQPWEDFVVDFMRASCEKESPINGLAYFIKEWPGFLSVCRSDQLNLADYFFNEDTLDHCNDQNFIDNKEITQVNLIKLIVFLDEHKIPVDYRIANLHCYYRHFDECQEVIDKIQYRERYRDEFIQQRLFDECVQQCQDDIKKLLAKCEAALAKKIKDRKDMLAELERPDAKLINFLVYAHNHYDPNEDRWDNYYNIRKAFNSDSAMSRIADIKHDQITVGRHKIIHIQAKNDTWLEPPLTLDECNELFDRTQDRNYCAIWVYHRDQGIGFGRAKALFDMGLFSPMGGAKHNDLDETINFTYLCKELDIGFFQRGDEGQKMLFTLERLLDNNMLLDAKTYRPSCWSKYTEQVENKGVVSDGKPLLTSILMSPFDYVCCILYILIEKQNRYKFDVDALHNLFKKHNKYYSYLNRVTNAQLEYFFHQKDLKPLRAELKKVRDYTIDIISDSSKLNREIVSNIVDYL